MKAVRVSRYGGPEVIELDEIVAPAPGDSEILVRVQAAGVGPWDALVRTGKSGLPQSLPLTLGSDIAGVVKSAGIGATGFAPGDEVFGVTNAGFTGGYAEYAVATAGMMAKKPASASFVDAASVPVVAVTAWKMLFEHAGVVRGETILVHGGAGNVGAYAVQLGHRAGARVVATADGRDAAFVRSIGADDVVDFKSQLFENAIANVDAVIDTVGGDVQARSFAVLKPGGTLVSSVSPPDAALAARLGVRADFFIVSVGTADLQRMADLIHMHELRTDVGVVLPLAQARKAHEMLAGNVAHPHGKIVLEIE